MMLYSGLPLPQARVRYLVEGYVPSIHARVRSSSGAEFLFVGLHPKPPVLHGSAPGDAELLIAGRRIRAAGEPAILAGDLNDVPWSATMQLFQEMSGLRDPRVGRGSFATYSIGVPLLRWPLDHAFVSPGFRLTRFESLRDVGSDHLPVLAELCTPGPSASRAATDVRGGETEGAATEAIRQGREVAADR